MTDTFQSPASGDVTRTTAVRMRVAFAPYFANNPYQNLLKGGLSSKGVEVEFRSAASEAEQEHFSGSPIDVLHLHWLPVMKRRPGSWLFAWKQIRAIKRLKAKGVGIVWTAHNRVPHESEVPALDKRLASKVASLADRIIVHSKAAQNEISKACGVDHGKIELIHHGSYCGVYGELRDQRASREKLGLGVDEFVFLFFGAVRPHKGVSDLIEAYRLANLDCRLVIAGNIKDKDFESELRKLEEELSGLKVISGFIPDEDLGLYFAASDIVVLPYQRSLTSGALVLAMSFGRACIVPDFDTFTEFIDAQGGFSYQAGSNAGLAEAMGKAVSARGNMEALGTHNGRIAERWDWQGVAAKTSVVYDQVIALNATR